MGCIRLIDHCGCFTIASTLTIEAGENVGSVLSSLTVMFNSSLIFLLSTGGNNFCISTELIAEKLTKTNSVLKKQIRSGGNQKSEMNPLVSVGLD